MKNYIATGLLTTALVACQGQPIITKQDAASSQRQQAVTSLKEALIHNDTLVGGIVCGIPLTIYSTWAGDVAFGDESYLYLEATVIMDQSKLFRFDISYAKPFNRGQPDLMHRMFDGLYNLPADGRPDAVLTVNQTQFTDWRASFFEDPCSALESQVTDARKPEPGDQLKFDGIVQYFNNKFGGLE